MGFKKKSVTISVPPRRTRFIRVPKQVKHSVWLCENFPLAFDSENSEQAFAQGDNCVNTFLKISKDLILKN